MLLLLVVIFSNVAGSRVNKHFDAITRSNKIASVFPNHTTINQIIWLTISNTSEAFQSEPSLASAILIEPASRAYKCFLKTNIDCDIFRSKDNFGTIIGPANFREEGPNNEEIASGGNPIYSVLNDHSIGRWNPSYLKIKEYNRTHFVLDVTWIVNKKALEVDTIKVFLSNSNYTDDQPIQKSLLNLVCSHQNSDMATIENYTVRFDCYIRTEFLKDLLYRTKGFGILVSTLKVVGERYSFYQVADVSLHKSTAQIINFHGFVSNPISRAKLCQLRVNENCGQTTYEPQSIEGFKGFPHGINSPPDGKIASGNNPNFDRLNEYGVDRWARVKFPTLTPYNETHVYFNISWLFTATHISDNIEVYVSNDKYRLSEPLSRRHLDLTPLCSIQFHEQHPPMQFTMLCIVSLTKYRQISQLKDILLLSVWNVKDTPFAFYQVIDCQQIPKQQTLKLSAKKKQIVFNKYSYDVNA